MNMLIRDLPIPLEVINQEFIEDLQATDLGEALEYSAGVYTRTFQDASGANTTGSGERSPSASVNVNNPFANAISIRGYSVPNQQRFGFRVGGIAVGEGFSVVLGGATDMVNARRLEVVRGPASLLYGVNVLSGVVNIMPKRPLSEPRYTTSLSLGSYGFRRATADASGPIIKDRLNYRLMGAYEEREHYTQFQSDKKEYISGQIEYQITPKTRLLAEVQYADQQRNGTGFQYFTDKTNNFDFRNPYGEFVEWGREDMSLLMDRDPSDPRDVFLLRKDNPPVPYSYGNLGDDYRISGPDTYTSREEFNAMLLLELEPIKNLNLELGAYYTDIKQEALSVTGNMVTDYDILGIRPDDTRPFIPVLSQAKLWVRHPEVLEILGGSLEGSGRVYGLDEAVGFAVNEGDIPNWTQADTAARRLAITTGGIADIFVIPDQSTRVNPDLPDNGNTTTTKYASYYWMSRPTESESLQLRLRAAYSFDTPIPFMKDGTVRHTIIGGFQHTSDNLLVVTGNPDPSDLVTPGQLEMVDGQLSLGRMGDDPYLLRNSIYDFTPIRYNGEPLAIPGSLSTSAPNMGQPLTTYVSQGANNPGNVSGFNIARSGWREVEAEYSGMYGIYQAQFFNDKVTLIAGMREDTYNVTETESLRLLDGIPQINPSNTASLTDMYFGSQTFATLPYQISGTERYTEDKWIADLPDALNQEIQREVDLFLEGLGPQGTRRDLFEEDQRFLTKSAGFSFRITEDLSMYATYSEGVFPNQGLRDGLDRPIPAEQTVGKEIGLKFDFFDGRISGTISFYQLTRENATWNFSYAPVPRAWIGGRLGDSPEAAGWGDFDAESALGGEGPKYQALQNDIDTNDEDLANYQRYSYGVHESFLKEAWEKNLGVPFFKINEDGTQDDGVNLQYLEGEAGVSLEWLMTNDFGMGGQRENAGKTESYYFVDVTRDFEPGKHVNADGVDIGLMFKEAFDAALLARDFDGLSVFWRSTDRNGPEGAGNNPSNNTGALVTFEEETFGVDGQIIFSPTNNYQILFTYSYQQREIVGNGFNLAPLIDPISGQTVPGTKYDRWVFALGEENFTDITDPTTFTGDGVNGLDLSFVPNWNFSLWNKYRFSEGPLENVELAAGARYYGEAPSSVPVGGNNLAENRFPTPPTPARLEFDASIAYRFDWMNIGWRLALKVNNLLDDRVDEQIVEYSDPGGPIDPVTRRTRVLYAPRTYRLMISADF
jgi:outer membrane receptor protein involved in Fe transport